jgi:maleylpyruvate isomerase
MRAMLTPLQRPATREARVVSGLVLHSYWRSSAAYRVRIGLNLKGVAYSQKTHDLRTGGHRTADYLAVQPQGLVPALETADGVLTQSVAILEWLDERYLDPPLLPASPADRAIVRGMAQIVAADIHPVNNLRVLNALRSEFGASEDQVSVWIHRWVAAGFVALEGMIAERGGPYCFGEQVTLADCVLVPQVYNAERFKTDLTPFPALMRAARAAEALPAFAAAHPSRQPDAEPV